MKPETTDSITRLRETLANRVVMLDGAMGTMIQALDIDESEWGRGCNLDDISVSLKGCNDLLSLSHPEKIADIHRRYLEAGADIIETNSFNANAISLSDYGVARMVGEINFAAAKVARKACDSYMARSGKPCWVAGSVGPTGKSLSMAAGLDGSSPLVSFKVLEDAYYEQMSALARGGVDLFLIETVFDALNAKAAIHAAKRVESEAGREIPIMISVTLTESGRTLAGQTLRAFVNTVAHAKPLSVGLNCGFGAEGMKPFIKMLGDVSCAVSMYPNAGLPDALGQYRETPSLMACNTEDVLRDGAVNILGGCCGTTPDHIAAMAEIASRYAPRVIPPERAGMRLAGLESLDLMPGSPFLKVGERLNVAGSRKFLRLIKEKNHDEAVDIAVSQISAGAGVLDVNMDDAMLDSRAEMSSFLRRLSTEPEAAKVPVMIDSSDFAVVTDALETVQGKPIVNSISLKEGEEHFLSQARHIASMGAAMVVMAFDEQGQADTFERRIEVCERAYRLLTDEGGINPEDIIFDPNILAIATGIDAHRNYAVDFLRALEWIKANLPGAKVSGGLSNLSFSFRGNNEVREAMHTVFLHHAVKRGMDMAIVNPSARTSYEELDPELRDAVEVVIFNRSDSATDRLIELAGTIAERARAAKISAKGTVRNMERSEVDPLSRLGELVVKGHTSGIDEAVDAAVAVTGNPLEVIDGPLMNAMNIVGDMFGRGEMFLPQVVKSARTMSLAVGRLTPLIEAERAGNASGSAGKMLIATVKGDVHDIGKNIVTVIMRCNGFEVIDLGVMVPPEVIVERAIAEKVDLIGLSGLITPSLNEMCVVAEMMEARGLKLPLMIGGATASHLHTAVKIAPCYSGPVVYTRDAAALPVVAREWVDPARRDELFGRLRQRQQELAEDYEATRNLLPLSEARRLRPVLEYKPQPPVRTGVTELEIPVDDNLIELINRRAFYAAWQLPSSVSEHSGEPLAAQVRQLSDDAAKMLDYLKSQGHTLHAKVVILPARSEGDDIVIDDGEVRIPTLRQQTPAVEGAPLQRLALADFVSPEDGDYAGFFAVTIGGEFQREINDAADDPYKSLLLQSLADRLVEAATELTHRKVRSEIWGYDQSEPDAHSRNENGEGHGIRPAFGYPSLPDQSIVFEADKVLDYKSMGITVTETGALSPSATTTGMLLAHPKARYFSVGRIGDDQKADYARRRAVDRDSLRGFLP